MDDGSDKLRRITQYRESNNQQAARRYADQSRDRLRRNMETKIRTTMIGAISAIEQAFGSLWGQGKPRDTLTPQELSWADVKDQLRTEILNNGNNQLRAAVSEINQYEVSWNRYQYELNNDKDVRTVFGIDEEGRPRKPRYGTNSDGSIKTSNQEGL